MRSCFCLNHPFESVLTILSKRYGSVYSEIVVDRRARLIVEVISASQILIDSGQTGGKDIPRVDFLFCT